jgi:hypothetical protein
MHGWCRRTNHLADPVLFIGCGNKNKTVARVTAGEAT